ncbi:hypothetical protein OGATHE_000315 [Ogataea polymorpha]|uniref:Uncharacterized protein n=1 Tax=Ogataea polymorpha TaxID=460523 RepID=A0A9P8TGM5_9ASCO|nr:hypothetical protein OGATHE_000315 [Ogataea polymorpha]
MTLLLGLSTLSLNQSLSVFVQVQFGDDNLGWMDVDWHAGTVGFLFGQFFELDGVFQSVHRGDGSLLALLGTSDNENLVVLSHWESLDFVLFSELLGQRSRHQNSSHRGWSVEVGLSGLGSGGGDVLGNLSHGWWNEVFFVEIFQEPDEKCLGKEHRARET